MTSANSSPTNVPCRSDRTLHVCILSAFAFSEPLFAALNQQFVYLHDLQAGWPEITVVVAFLTVVVPAVWVLIDRWVQRMAALWGGTGRDVTLYFLSCLVFLSLLRPFMKNRLLEESSCTWMATLAVAIPATFLFMYAYRHASWFRFWLSVATVGLVCFPASFLYQYASLQQSQTQQQKPKVPVENPVPVVFVVFDEFSGTTLMNDQLKLDSVHFPQFARLAEMSTWFTNASTVHCRTDFAVPSLLTGRLPAVKRPPLASEYPGNLLQLIYESGAFDFVAFEPITRLCPQAACFREPAYKTFQEKIVSLTQTLSAVYPRLLLPDDTPVDFPPISRIWFGVTAGDRNEDRLRQGLIRHLPFARRDEQLRQYLACIRASDQPPFCFLHVELPHVPWYFLPNGHYYNYMRGHEFEPRGTLGDLGEEWVDNAAIVARNEHRYLHQVQYVDRFIGELLDHLERIKLLDQCLLVVAADHGVSFRPGHSRRTPDTDNLADILSVPLFIKLPGQKEGKTDDSNVESVDVFPSIAEVLGLKLTEPVDGSSVLENSRRLRKTLFVEQSMTVLEPTIPRIRDAVERRTKIFGNHSWDSSPPISSSHPEWHGRSIRDFTILDAPSRTDVNIEAALPSTDVGSSPFVPGLVHGTVGPRSLLTPVSDLVLVVNDVVCDTCLTVRNRFAQQEFEFLIPEDKLKRPPGKVELFIVEDSAERMRLRRVNSNQLPTAEQVASSFWNRESE